MLGVGAGLAGAGGATDSIATGDCDTAGPFVDPCGSATGGNADRWRISVLPAGTAAGGTAGSTAAWTGGAGGDGAVVVGAGSVPGAPDVTPIVSIVVGLSSGSGSPTSLSSSGSADFAGIAPVIGAGAPPPCDFDKTDFTSGMSTLGSATGGTSPGAGTV